MLRLLAAAAFVLLLTSSASEDAAGGAAAVTPDGLRRAEDAAREFWEGTNPSFAFLDQGSISDVRTVSMMRSWHAKFLGRYDWSDRVVVDYGAATGLLGEWLLQTGGARHYVAADISERAVKAARKRLTLAGYADGHRGKFEAVQAPVELCTLSATRDAQEHPPPADTLISTKTLQHFASIEMLVAFFRNVRHSGIDTVMLQLVEGGENTCYGTAEEYAHQTGPDSVISRLGHWCRVTVEFVQRELAGGPGASLLGGGSADGLPSYVLEWTEREEFSIPAENLKPREVGQPPPQQDFTNVYLGFRRVKAAQEGHRTMARHSALIGGVISPDQRPGGADDMVQLLQRTAWPFKQKAVLLIVLPGTGEHLVNAFTSAAAAASTSFPACAVRILHPTAPAQAYHGGWAYNILLDEAAVVAADYLLLADLSLYDFKLHAGSTAGLGHGPGTGWRVDGVATSFAHVGWDVMCANGVYGSDGAFYDTQSLRTDQLPDTTSLHERGVHLSPHLTPFHAMTGEDADAPPVHVDACFGGLMVVRRALVSVGRCYYEPSALTWAEAHFGFHNCMRRARAGQQPDNDEVVSVRKTHISLSTARRHTPPIHAKGCVVVLLRLELHLCQRAGTFVNPAMMVHYDSESARETCSVVDCDPSYDDPNDDQACAFEIEEATALDGAKNVLGETAGTIKSSTLAAWTGNHAHKPGWLVSQTEGEVNQALKEAIIHGDLNRAEDALRACEMIGVSLDADYAGVPGTPLTVAVSQRNNHMVRWLLSQGASVGRAASGRSDLATSAPLVLAAELGEAGMVLQMLSNSNTGGRRWLRANPEGRVAAILELIATRPTTNVETSKQLMDTIEVHHREEAEQAGYKKHVYYKGADWAGGSEAGEAAEELRQMGRVQGAACESRPCKNGGACADLLENDEDDLYNLDGDELEGASRIASYECQCKKGWVGSNCEEMSPEIEGLEALRSLIGGTYKDGALDRMWGQSKRRHQRSPQTPLMAAAAVGWVGGVDLMLSLGATGELVDEHGNDAMHAALQIFKSEKPPKKAEITAAAAIVSLLMQAGVAPSEKDWSSVHGRAGRWTLVDELRPRLRARLMAMLRKVPDSGDQRIGRGRPLKKDAGFIKRKAGYHERRAVERSRFSDL